jgi:serine/threonine-protein kinase
MVRIVEQTARGLHHLHELRDSEGRPKRAIHRDVAPKNILVSYDGQVKITDFGLVSAEQRVTGTMMGILKGTPAYFSPEQTLAQVVLDRRSDVFSLGTVLWEVTLLRRLFKHDRELDTLMAIRNARASSPSAYCSWYPPELGRILLKALSRERADRFSSALEMADALDEFLSIGGSTIGPKEVAAVMHTLFSPTVLPPPSQPSSFVMDPDYNTPTLEDLPAYRIPTGRGRLQPHLERHDTEKMGRPEVSTSPQTPAVITGSDRSDRFPTSKQPSHFRATPSFAMDEDESQQTRKFVSLISERIEVPPMNLPLDDAPRYPTLENFDEETEDTKTDAPVTHDTIATPVVPPAAANPNDTLPTPVVPPAAANPNDTLPTPVVARQEPSAVDTLPSLSNQGPGDPTTATRPGHQPLPVQTSDSVAFAPDSSLIDLSKPRWGLLHRLKRLIGKG